MAPRTATVTMTPEEALRSVIEVWASSGVYAVESQGAGYVTFSREKNPGMLIGCSLLLLGLIPGLLYLGLAGGRVRVTVTAGKSGPGSTVSFGAERWLDKLWVSEWERAVNGEEQPREKDFRKLGRDPDVSHLSIYQNKSKLSEHPDDPRGFNTEK